MQNDMIDFEKLFKSARLAKNNSYCPYSDFKSGSSVLTLKGTIYSAGSVEVAGSTTCCCSMRLAIYKAVSDGNRNIIAAATTGDVIGAKPRLCGVCRQVLSEFLDIESLVYFIGENITSASLKSLLPDWKE